MNAFERKSIEHFNQEADVYDNSFDGRTTEKYKALLLEEIRIKPHDCVLDVGCGSGRFLKMLSDKCVIEGYGVDIAEKMIENARKNCPDMTFEVTSCEHTSFQNHMFDVITVCVALHHFPDLRAFAEEASRILKPEGLLFLADGRLPFIIREIYNLFMPLSKSGDVKVYSPGEIRSAFKIHGFEMIGLKRSGMYRMLIIMRKN